MSAAETLGKSGPLARAIEGYEDRPSQLAMARAVEDALAHGGISLIEAPTGTGKTLAYLVPAILSGKKVVISTGTKTLQDQIMQHDLPLLQATLGIPFTAACMKGLGNYLCLRRYDEFVHSAEADKAPFAYQLPLVKAFREKSESGERADLHGLPEDAPIWSQVNSGSDTRIGSRCRHFDACFVTQMRREAQEAQIVIVNHHLFFADLATRGPHGGGALPNYDAVVFDEAHQIEDVITEFFGVRVSTTRLEVLVRDALRSAAVARVSDSLGPLADQVMQVGAAFFAGLPRGPAGQGGGRQPLLDGKLTASVEQTLYALDAALEALALHAKSHAAESEALAQLSRRAEQVRDDLARIAQGDSYLHVVWTEVRGRHVSIGASPVDASGILREQLFERGGAVLMTSATLTTGNGSFEFVRERLGIDFEVDELSLPSPFEYPQQAALYLPTTLPDPRSEDYVEAAAREILALVALTGGGAFVLCTSLAMMKRLHDRCRAELREPPLLQGTAPKGALLDTFRRRGDAVLFASASFWEGVDVPGDALRLVVIDKLPFEVPSDPLVQARCARVEERGHNAFMRYLVPNAALALKQGFGRLVRSRSDRGIVAVLDRRLTSKGYGKVLLRSLPPASRCHSMAEVQAFWAQTTGATSAGTCRPADSSQ